MLPLLTQNVKSDRLKVLMLLEKKWNAQALAATAQTGLAQCTGVLLHFNVHYLAISMLQPKNLTDRLVPQQMERTVGKRIS